jgi:tRNA(Ile)-lysidine synthase
MMLLKAVVKTIERYQMFSRNDSVVVGLSGGADSVALLMVLLELQKKYALKLYAVHINHNLRDNADADESFVRELCKTLNIPLRVYTTDVRKKARKEKTGIEEAGRRVRYDYFHTALEEMIAQKIAVGHNANDNAETVLLNLCRGAGLRGLCGIPPVNKNIVRPLIETPRKQIEEYLTEKNIRYITDDTNNGFDYTRNRIRNIILPTINEHINPNAAENIIRNISLLRLDSDYLETTAKEAFVACIHGECEIDSSVSLNNHHLLTSESLNKHRLTETESTVSLNINRLLTLPEALLYRVVREAIRHTRLLFQNDTDTKTLRSPLQNNTDIHAVHVADVLDIIKGTSGREVFLPGIRVRRDYDVLRFFSVSQKPCGGFFYPLEPNKPLYIPEINKTILFSFSPPEETPLLLCTHSFNYDILSESLSDLCVRSRKPGDRISQKKKLQDYFTDTKTPRYQRDKIALVAIKNEILWVMDKNNKINRTKTTSFKNDNPTHQNLCYISLRGIDPDTTEDNL